MNADAGVHETVELEGMRERAIRERRKLAASLVLGADDRAFARRSRAHDVLDDDAAPRHVGAESHRAYRVDDARLRAVDDGVRYGFVFETDCEFGERACGGGSHLA